MADWCDKLLTYEGKVSGRQEKQQRREAEREVREEEELENS